MAVIPLENLAGKLGGDLDQWSRAFTIALFNGVVRDTRVDTGRLRGGWQASVNSAKEGETGRLDPNGTAVFSEIVGTVRAESVNWLTNSVVYAAVYEEKDGMIAKNVARLSRTAKEAVK